MLCCFILLLIVGICAIAYIKWGPKGSPSSPSPPPPTPSGTCGNKLYAQCGGTGWTGLTCCPDGSSCTGSGYYFQCVPTSALSLATTPPAKLAKPFTPCGAEAACTAGYACDAGLCMPTAERIKQAGHGAAFNTMLTEARKRIATRKGGKGGATAAF
mmetsp:Transcript_34635/g.95532  ORF Transcript_34635/g.95532 Transcript_34635/m.95532 type:complete len:157 (+) Transcript_34635:2-472(+)